jgi:hypothetical protein
MILVASNYLQTLARDVDAATTDAILSVVSSFLKVLRKAGGATGRKTK